MSGILKFDYSKAMRQVAELRSIANDMTGKCNQKIGSAISGIECSWKGENGQKFLSKCRQLEDKVKNEAKRIRALADEYSALAEAMRKAEMEAQTAAANTTKSL